ncbi:MAG: TonB-dependent receptor [Alphaproteobacteria bacterium]|nr:TonB-dependent receptor [Alphaproteobacteria bacterium]
MALSLLGVGLALAEPSGATAPEPTDGAVPRVSQLVVTATRTPEPVDQVPADISVVTGADLRARDAHDLASALALVSGVEAPAGGDAGPSSAVPAFWGLHEFDAFLLVVDGVPWGGAFNPMITTLDMNDVDRIEVLKGSAPVMFGATSFVGVVQELHYPAGQAANLADIAYGAYGSARGEASWVLPTIGDFKQSLAVDGESIGFADRRERVADGKALYRGELDKGDSKLTLDADVTLVRDTPTSPVIRDGAGLTTLTPLDANFNPADARIDQTEYHAALGYERPTPLGQWSSLISIAHSDITDIRAFLHPDLSGAADTQNQDRHIDDDYADTHLTHRFGDDTTLIVGADLLYGLGKQTTRNGNDGYTVPLTGAVLPPSTGQVAVNEIGKVDDRRVFVGQYAQLDWKPSGRWDVTAGVRLNETDEHKVSSDATTPPPVLLAQTAHLSVVRPTETLGVSYRAWGAGGDELVLYADYRYAFKPAALDFGPDYTPDILQPETAHSYEAGLKGALDQGRLTFQAEAFRLDFANLVVPTPSGALANAAGERLLGVDLDAQWALTRALSVAANLAWHDATFSNYLFVDPVTSLGVNVAGHQLPLSPHVLASAGLVYAPPEGLNASVTASYVGRQFLDEENTAPVKAYATLAATLGYRFGRYGLTLEGDNLTNARPPVAASEFGSQSYYLLNPRMVWVRLSYKL